MHADLSDVSSIAELQARLRRARRRARREGGWWDCVSTTRRWRIHGFPPSRPRPGLPRSPDPDRGARRSPGDRELPRHRSRRCRAGEGEPGGGVIDRSRAVRPPSLSRERRRPPARRDARPGPRSAAKRRAGGLRAADALRSHVGGDHPPDRSRGTGRRRRGAGGRGMQLLLPETPISTYAC